VDYLDHSFDFLRRDRPGATLFPQQVHHVGGKFVTGLKDEDKASLVSLPVNPSEGDASHLKCL